MPRIDWNAIKQRVSNDTLLFALDRHWQQLLLSNVESYQWQATYRTADYDYADWDTLRSVVEKGTNDLMEGILLADIIGYIDEIEGLLTDLKNKECCAPLDPDAVTIQPTTDLPLSEHTSTGTTYPATYAGVTMTDANMYHLYLCGAANQLVDRLIEQAGVLDTYAEIGIVTSALVASVWLTVVTGGAALPVSAALLLAFLAAFKDAWQTGSLDSSIADLETNRDAVVCAALANDPDLLSSTVESIVSAAAWNMAFKWFNYNDMVAVLFTGEVNGTDISVTPAQETCTCEPYYDFDYSWYFDSTQEGWALNKAAWTSAEGGSIQFDPTWQGWTYMDLQEGTILTALGLPTNTNLQVETVDIEYLRSSAAYAAPATLRVQVNSEAENEYTDYDYATLSQAVTTLRYQPTTPSVAYCQTGSSAVVVRMHLTRSGDPNPRMWIRRVRVAGWVNP